MRPATLPIPRLTTFRAALDDLGLTGVMHNDDGLAFTLDIVAGSGDLYDALDGMNPGDHGRDSAVPSLGEGVDRRGVGAPRDRTAGNDARQCLFGHRKGDQRGRKQPRRIFRSGAEFSFYRRVGCEGRISMTRESTSSI